MAKVQAKVKTTKSTKVAPKATKKVVSDSKKVDTKKAVKDEKPSKPSKGKK